MEYEVRYYFNTSKKEEIINMLKNIDEIKMEDRCYEKTIQYDHPCSDMSFYSKK